MSCAGRAPGLHPFAFGSAAILSRDPKVELAREILRLYLQNPNMVSDVEDIVRWRLLQQDVLRQMEEVRQAVGWLVEKGFLSLQQSEGMAELYVLNRERREDAERLSASGILERKGPV